MIDPKQKFTDPSYLQGQIDGLFALFASIADSLPMEAIIVSADRRFDSVLDSLLPNPVSELRLEGANAIKANLMALFRDQL